MGFEQQNFGIYFYWLSPEVLHHILQAWGPWWSVKRGPGRQGEILHGRPLREGGGPYESGLILDLTIQICNLPQLGIFYSFSSYLTIIEANVDREKGYNSDL